MSTAVSAWYSAVFDEDKVGRQREVPPCPVTALDADEIAKQVHGYALKFLGSRDVDTSVDLGAMAGDVTAGGRTVARFRLRDAWVTLTQQQLLVQARQRFGHDDPERWAYRCPQCGDLSFPRDWDGQKQSQWGQACVGRHIDGRGCEWVAYGMIPGPWSIIMPTSGKKGQRPGPTPDTHIVHSFALAPADAVAARLAELAEAPATA